MRSIWKVISSALLLCVVLLIIPTGCQGPEGSNEADNLKVAIIGIDGATWEIVDELMAQGKLPNLQKLIKTGVRADYRSLDPMLSPVIWTSMATGVTPERHGITWFMVRDPKTGEPLPITSSKREVKAIWNMVGDNDKTVGFIGWWATWPAEKVNGFMVSDQIAYHGFGLGAKKDLARTFQTYPESLFFDIQNDMIDPLKQSKTDIAPFMEVSDEEYALSSKGPFRFRNPLQHFMYMLATLTSYETIGLKLYKRYKPDLFGIYFEAIDTTGHLYMKYRSPQVEGISDELFRKYRSTIDAVYQRNDEAIGRFLNEFQDNTIVMVCSDHGFKVGEDRLAELKNTSVATAHLWHTPRGVLIINGPGIKQGHKLEDAGVLDLTPTVLYALGLPIAEDFDGRILKDAFTQEFQREHPIKTLPSFETDGARNKSTLNPPPEITREMQERLKSLGYIAGDEAEPEQSPQFDSIETHLNRLDIFRRKGDLAETHKLAEEMVRMDPRDPRVWTVLGDVLANIGRPKGALEAIERAEGLMKMYQTNPPRYSDGRLKYPQPTKKMMSFIASTRAVCLMADKKYSEAEKQFLKAQKLDPDNVQAYYNFALMHEMKKNYIKAIEAYEETIRKSPQHPYALNNLGNVYARVGRMDDALEMYRRTAVADPKHLRCHHNRGVIFMQKGKVTEAIQSFREALKRNPRFVSSLLNLGKALSDLGENEEALEVYIKLANLRPTDFAVQRRTVELLNETKREAEARDLFGRIRNLNPDQAQEMLEANPGLLPEGAVGGG
jgi:tetratricopeptide (TPR) repeat protein